MNQYNEGDLIEAVKGETRLAGRLSDLTGSLGIKDAGWPLDLLLCGWTVTVIEPATPKVELPAEPGVYQDARGNAWVHDDVFFYRASASDADHDDPADFAPFTRLESRADTAKAVLDAVETGLASQLGDYWIGRLDVVAAEFGVTS